jgi:hypothetical protein
VPKLIMSGGVPLHPLYASMVWTGTTLSSTTVVGAASAGKLYSMFFLRFIIPYLTEFQCADH